jgi:hypothetical protein
MTLAVSRILQEDLKRIITREQASWRVVDSGIVPPYYQNPKAQIYIVDTSLRDQKDYTDRQKYAGGKYFRVDLQIRLSMEDDYCALWQRKYQHANHIVCRILRGDSFAYRSGGLLTVCEGVYSLLDTPDATPKLAEKIRIVMNSWMATQLKIDPH